jgi:hypothetical protein
MGRLKQNLKNTHPKRKTVQIAGWGSRSLKEAVKRTAEKNGISESAVVVSLVEKGIQQSIDMEYGAMLRPVIQDAVDKSMRSALKKQTNLLVRNAFDAGQIRGIVINILGRLQGITPEILNQIIDEAAIGAKKRITNRTPQLKDLITEVEKDYQKKSREM